MSNVDEIFQLSVPERIRLVEELWDSIATETKQPELSENQKRELDQRLESHLKNPQEGISWEALKKKLKSSS